MSNSEGKRCKRNIFIGIKHGRIVSQILFLGLTVWVAYRMLSGIQGATIEKYCPFGGVETLFPWLSASTSAPWLPASIFCPG